VLIQLLLSYGNSYLKKTKYIVELINTAYLSEGKKGVGVLSRKWVTLNMYSQFELIVSLAR